MDINNKHVLTSIAVCFMLLQQTTLSTATAQESHNVVQPLKESRLRPLNFEFRAFIAGGYQDCGRPWDGYYSEGMETIRGDVGRMLGSSFKIGMETVASNSDFYNLYVSAGYKYERYAYEWGLFDLTGINTHWLTTDVGVNFIGYVCAGIHADVFLNSNTKQNDNFAFEGINKKCFNNLSLDTYVGIEFSFGKVKTQLCYSFWTIKPHLNVDKLAFYTMERVRRMKSEHFELRLSYQLFTTKSVYYTKEE